MYLLFVIKTLIKQKVKVERMKQTDAEKILLYYYSIQKFNITPYSLFEI